MWGESGAGRSPQCGARRAQPMGSADGGARGGGGGGGRYFSGGRASAALSGGAERSGEAPTRSRQAARRVRGGARAAEAARRADGGGERSARGCGSRRPRRRLLLQEEPKGHRPCLLPALGHRCSLEGPPGLACVKVSGGWGCPRACGLRPLCATARAVPLRPPRLTRAPEQSWLRCDALGAPPSRSCATPCSGSRLEALGCRGAALVSLGSFPALRGGLWCLGPSGWGGEASSVTRLLLPPPPPPPSGASFVRRGRPVTPAPLRARRGRAADPPGRRWGGGCFFIPQVLAFWGMGWWRDMALLKGEITSVCVSWGLGRAVYVFRRLSFFPFFFWSKTDG